MKSPSPLSRIAALNEEIENLELMILAIVEQHPGTFITQAQLRRLKGSDRALLIQYVSMDMVRLDIGSKEDAKHNQNKANRRPRHRDNRVKME